MRKFLRIAAVYTLAALAGSFFLSGCASNPANATNSANNCVGPASYCNVFFD
jgi:hypothetical protein